MILFQRPHTSHVILQRTIANFGHKTFIIMNGIINGVLRVHTSMCLRMSELPLGRPAPGQMSALIVSLWIVSVTPFTTAAPQRAHGTVGTAGLIE